MLLFLAFAIPGFGIPFLILRRTGGTLRSLMAWFAGFVVTFLAAFALEVSLHPNPTGSIFGVGVSAAVVWPIFATAAARGARKRAKRAA